MTVHQNKLLFPIHKFEYLFTMSILGTKPEMPPIICDVYSERRKSWSKKNRSLGNSYHFALTSALTFFVIEPSHSSTLSTVLPSWWYFKEKSPKICLKSFESYVVKKEVVCLLPICLIISASRWFIGFSLDCKCHLLVASIQTIFLCLLKRSSL